MSDSQQPYTMSGNAMNGATRGPVVLVVTAVMIILSTLFVLLRLISRFGIVRRVAWDDYFMIIAWVCDFSSFQSNRSAPNFVLQFLAFGLSFSICYGTHVGLGMHEVDIPENWNAALKKSEYAFSVLYVSLYCNVPSD